MLPRGSPPSFVFLLTLVATTVPQVQAQSSSSASAEHVRKPAPATDSQLGAGAVSQGVYRNKALELSCKIPPGWVLRTDEMNARNDEGTKEESPTASDSIKTGRVLLAAFSRPPDARAEDVNSSILIAAESMAAYPGLKEAAQYFGPVSEVAKAQGFEVANEPYEFMLGTKIAGLKSLVRADFQKSVGTRVMRQSTLVMLARGYAVSFTFIGGTEDEVEELVHGLSFGAPRTTR